MLANANAFHIEDEQLTKAIANWEHSEQNKGQIYTKPEVVDFMLDCLGLNGELWNKDVRVLEPSCGEGEFVVAIVKRLLNQAPADQVVPNLVGKLLAVDLVADSIEITKKRVGELLMGHGVSNKDAELLKNSWFKNSDFLLDNTPCGFTHIVGNPPYVRVEDIPKRLLEEYRSRFVSMTDRADLYIPFYEKSLNLLRPKGALSFICTDRWTKNRYGKGLRKLISEQYGLELFIDLYGVDAFTTDVMTYPAITQIRKAKSDSVALIHGSSFSASEAEEVVAAISGISSTIQLRKGIVNGAKPWLVCSPDQVRLIHHIENHFPTLEEAGCNVSIGAATGSNKVYIVDMDDVDVEPERLLPVITAAEIKNGIVNWKGKYIINTYHNGEIIDIENFPLLNEYLRSHKETLSGRHVAKKNPDLWYKTIDKVHEDRAAEPKLLIPDIASDPVVVVDEGVYHPNNSIYYIRSNEWNLYALKFVLMSDVTKLFISTYSTKISGGYMRYQAQHLRKIRLPRWGSIKEDLRDRLIDAGMNNNSNNIDLIMELYELDNNHRVLLGG
ncbi:Eco57I restriction-modification methylase domain-containing protein [Vibrio cyclitrophicus]|uniref:Eco57I restriction-modification methylase domain-containing protein n=1 Tax=Vibrio cyclitrophicus TaxID=47951 RepID=UPI000CB82AA0|nr:TaqI-like C-terminal specificity domain-containing protein [Vibrio cyclitrophicus]PMG33344.1 hypothetical protein BCU92_05730 [Vibrio cyclitrophicus]